MLLEFISRAASLPERLYEGTRLKTWPEGEPLRLEIFSLASHPDHLRLIEDAAATFHPGSVLTRRIFPEPAPGAGATEPGVAILAHPRPYELPEDAAALATARAAFMASPAPRKWIVQRDMKIMDGSRKARWIRRAVRPFLARLESRPRREEEKVLNDRVLPFLERALAWEGETPCRHEAAREVFTRPRRIRFCPDCGMGVPPAGAPPEPEAAAAVSYGPGYARSFTYTGDEEMERYFSECGERLAGRFARMGFDPSSLPPNLRSVVDYGCGNGRYAPFWMGLGFRYLGVDTSDANIAFARAFFAKAPRPPGAAVPEFRKIAPQIEAAAQLPPAGVIFISHVLEHVPDPEALLRSLHRGCLPGGRLYAEVPDAAGYAWSAERRGYANAEHLWDFTPAMLAAVARSAGWTPLEREVEAEAGRDPAQALIAGA